MSEGCASNPFCSKLPDDLRVRLCEHCVKTTHAKGSVIRADENRVWIILDGILLGLNSDKPTSMHFPGRMNMNTSFMGPDPAFSEFMAQDIEVKMRKLKYLCLRPIELATFSNRTVHDLMDDPRFLRVLWDNLLGMTTETTSYMESIYCGSAADAVRYVLALAKSHEVGDLTHEEIARLSGKNRVTVTKIMHELALSSPELLP